MHTLQGQHRRDVVGGRQIAGPQQDPCHVQTYKLFDKRMKSLVNKETVVPY